MSFSLVVTLYYAHSLHKPYELGNKMLLFSQLAHIHVPPHDLKLKRHELHFKKSQQKSSL